MQQNACLHVRVSQFACVHLYQCEQSLHVLIHLSECKRLNSSMCLGYLYTWMLFFWLRHILNTTESASLCGWMHLFGQQTMLKLIQSGVDPGRAIVGCT